MQEGAAILVWQKTQRVELLKTIAVVTATVDPEKAQKSLNLLIEEMFPDRKVERDRAVANALEIMEGEQKRVYNVKKTELKKSAIGRKLQRVFKKK